MYLIELWEDSFCRERTVCTTISEETVLLALSILPRLSRHLEAEHLRQTLINHRCTMYDPMLGVHRVYHFYFKYSTTVVWRKWPCVYNDS